MNGPLEPNNPLGPKDSRAAAPRPGAPSAPEPMLPEEAGSQALSDALRSSFAIVRVIMVILVIVFFASGVFTVPSQEKAIVLRFGRPVGTGEEQLLGPGLHWSFPYPIDEVVRIPISQIQTVTSRAGWYATTPEAEQTNTEPEAGPSLNPAADGYALTGDGNIVHLRMTLRYRVNNPLNYTLNFVNASSVVQNALDSALIHSTAQFTVDEALRLAVVELKERILARVRQQVDEQGLGIIIEDALLVTIPPRYVKKSFDDVYAAAQDREKSVTEAHAYASRTRNSAAGEANLLVNTGKAEAERIIQGVAAEAHYFNDQLPHYQRNPNLFMARLQTESLQRILTNAQDKILRMDQGERPMWIQLNREPVRPGQPQQGQAQQGQPQPGQAPQR